MRDKPTDLRHVDAWIFDLDNTLYDPRHDLFGQIDRKMKAFIANALKLSPDDAFALQKKYYWDHGTTLRGLMINHDIAPDDFLHFVHDIDHSVLPADAELDAALSALPGRKFVYTNGSTYHAERTVEKLGVARHFAGIFDIRDARYIPKPDPAPYAAMIAAHGIDAKKAVMVEDIHRNLKPAKDLGMGTVWLRHAHNKQEKPADLSHCTYVIDDLVGWLRAAAQ